MWGIGPLGGVKGGVGITVSMHWPEMGRFPRLGILWLRGILRTRARFCSWVIEEEHRVYMAARPQLVHNPCEVSYVMSCDLCLDH